MHSAFVEDSLAQRDGMERVVVMVMEMVVVVLMEMVVVWLW